MRGLLQAERGVDLNRPDLCHAPDIIAAKVEQHQMFGALLFIGQQIGADICVFACVCAAFARTGNGANIHLAVFDTNQNFRAGTDNAEIFKLQIEQIGEGFTRRNVRYKSNGGRVNGVLKRWLMTT